MTRIAWHASWKRMRGETRRRDWLTWSEFQSLLITLLGVTMTPYHVKQATRSYPPERVHGLKRYRDCHVQMAVGYARAKGLVRTPEPEPEEVEA